MFLYSKGFSILLSSVFTMTCTFSNFAYADNKSGRRPDKFSEGRFGTVIDRDQMNRGGSARNQCKIKFDKEIDRSKRDLDQKEMDACEAGFEAGVKLAQRVGENQGRAIGRIHGLSKGMDVAFDYAKDDYNQIQRGKNSVRDTIFLTAESRVFEPAKERAIQEANNDVYLAFKQAVDRQSSPDSSVRQPIINYSGLTDGYSFDNQPFVSEERMFRAELDRRSVFPDMGRGDDFFDSNERDEFSGNDFYWKIRVYRGDSNQVERHFSSWKNSSKAFSFYINSSASGEFSRIREGVRTEYKIQEKPVTQPPAGGVAGGAGGAVTTNPPPNNPPANTSKVPVKVNVSADYYKRIFEDSFKRSYSEVIENAFAKAYHQALEIGYNKGLDIGESVGLQMAYQSGVIQEYNTRYQDASIGAYQKTFRQVYDFEFRNSFKARMENTIIEIEKVEIIGQSNDGILRAGESIAANYIIANYGGKAKTVKVKLYGDIQGESKEMVLQVPAYRRITGSTKLLAQVSFNKGPREIVNLGIDVDSVKRPVNLQINTIVEIAGMSVTDLSAVNGSAVISVNVVNPTTVVNPQSHQLVLNVEGLNAPVIKTVEPLQPGENRKVIFSLSDVDPLLLINKGVSANVVVKMSGEVLDQNQTLRNVSNKVIDLTTYYDQLVLGTEKLAKPIIPLGVDSVLRLQAVQIQIFKEVQSEIGNKYNVDENLWKKHPEQSYVGQLSLHYASHAPKSPQYTAFYQGLGSMLWPLRMTFDDSIFKSSRSSYAELVKTFSKVEGKNKK